MAFKIYTKGSIFYIEDTLSGLIHEGLSKDVLVRRLNSSSTDFYFKGVNNFEENEPVSFDDILNIDSNTYSSIGSFISFYENNTGGNATPRDYMLDVQRGLKIGERTITVLGRSANITTANIPESLWMKGGLYHNPNGIHGEAAHTGWISSASILTINSTSASDNLSGTGAQKVIVVGLDENRLEITEEIELNGTTDVLTINQFLRVNMFLVTQAGSNETNVGDIQIFQTGSPLNIMSFIENGHSYAQSAIWSVPSDETWYMWGVDGYLYDIGNAGNIGVLTFMEKRNGVLTRYLDFAVGTKGSTAQVDVSDKFVMPSGSDWEMRVLEIANNGARASFNGILLRIKN